MIDKRMVIFLWGGALLVLVTGVAYTVATYSACVEAQERINRKVKEYSELKQLEKKVARYDAALAAFDKMDNKRISDLKKDLQDAFHGVNPDEIRESRQEGVNNWIVKDVEAALNDVVLSKVMNLAVKAEQRRPPWILTKCVLTASPRIDNHGNAVLTFRGVTK